MLPAAIAFLALGLLSILLSVNSVGGMSLDAGKVLLVVFVILSVISFFASLAGRKPADPYIKNLPLDDGKEATSDKRPKNT